jgi:hypothetical protein
MQRRPGAAPPLVLAAARRLERFGRRVARETHRDAFIAVVYAGRFAGETGLPEVAAAARSAAPSAEPPSPTDELLDAVALLIDAGRRARLGHNEALTASCVAPISRELDMHWLAAARARPAPWCRSRRPASRPERPPRQSGRTRPASVSVRERISACAVRFQSPAADRALSR